MDVAGANREPGAEVIFCKGHDGTNQDWKMDYNYESSIWQDDGGEKRVKVVKKGDTGERKGEM